MVHQGGFAGKQFNAKDSTRSAMRIFCVMIPSAMFFNKVFQGNIWGVPNREEGIVPIQTLLGKPTDKFIDTYIRSSLDTGGFVGDDAARKR